MLQEAGEFAAHLKKIEKDIRGLKNATEGEEPGAGAQPPVHTRQRQLAAAAAGSSRQAGLCCAPLHACHPRSGPCSPAASASQALCDSHPSPPLPACPQAS